MNRGIYAVKKCWTCGNEIKGRCGFCSVKPRKKKLKREKQIDKTIRRALRIKEQENMKAKTAYRKIMEAQEFWMKNI